MQYEKRPSCAEGVQITGKPLAAKDLLQQPQKVQAKSGVMDGVKLGFGMFVVLPVIIIGILWIAVDFGKYLSSDGKANQSVFTTASQTPDADNLSGMEFSRNGMVGCFLSKPLRRYLSFSFSQELAGSPTENVLYSLKLTSVVQTTPDGVLITANSNAVPWQMVEQVGAEPSENAFLYTKEDFVDGADLDGRWAYYVGTYQYATVFGAGKKIYAFKLVGKNKIGELKNPEPNFISMNGKVVPNPRKYQPQ